MTRFLKHFIRTNKKKTKKNGMCVYIYIYIHIHIIDSDFTEVPHSATGQKFIFRVRIKRIAIAKCDLFFYYRDAKKISFLYFCDAKLCAKYEKTR